MPPPPANKKKNLNKICDADLSGAKPWKIDVMNKIDEKYHMAQLT